MGGAAGIPIQAAISELPEWLQSALYRGAAKGGLTETDPLWGCLVANGELLKSYLDAQADGTKKSVEELTQAIRELSRSVKHRVEPESRPENIAKLWAAILYCGRGGIRNRIFRLLVAHALGVGSENARGQPTS